MLAHSSGDYLLVAGIAVSDAWGDSVGPRRDTLSTKNEPTDTAVVSPVQKCKCLLAVVAGSAKAVGHLGNQNPSLCTDISIYTTVFGQQSLPSLQQAAVTGDPTTASPKRTQKPFRSGLSAPVLVTDRHQLFSTIHHVRHSYLRRLAEQLPHLCQ